MGHVHPFSVLGVRLSIVRLESGARPPEPPGRAVFWSLTLTEEELSVVCDEATAEALYRPGGEGGRGSPPHRGFRALKLLGPLDLSLTGVLAGFLAPLAAAQIPVFVLSTFDTDYVLVREEHLRSALAALGSTS